MAASTLAIFLLCTPSLVFGLHGARHARPNPLWRRGEPSAGYYDPNSAGGSMLTQVNGTFPAGQGEPINAILSGNSDSAILQDTETNGGFRNYVLSFGFSSECLGQHSGSDQAANLGDGHGYRNETAVLRWDYGDPSLGTCKETIQGGNHFRYWVQDGGSADSNAIFMAVSYEEPIAEQHDIIFDGYNLARDWLVGNATAQGTIIPTGTLTNASTYSGSTSYGGYTYQTNVQYISGLLPNTSIGINHNATVGTTGLNAVDGLVALLDVKITASPAGSSSSKSSASWTASPVSSQYLLVTIISTTLLLPLILS